MKFSKMQIGPYDSYKAYIKHKKLVLVLVFIIVIFCTIFSLCFGSSLDFTDTILTLFGQGDTYSNTVVFNLRMPRVFAAMVGGFALALSGCVFQGVLRNPLASASTLGVSHGAAFGAAVAIIVLGFGSSASVFEGIFISNPLIIVICAFVGSMISTFVILLLSRIRNMSAESIVLGGVALSAFFAGLTAVVQYFAEDTQIAAIVFWTFGQLGRVGYVELFLIAIVTFTCFIFFYFNRWNFNAMENGEDLAHSLSLKVKQTRIINMVVASFLASNIIAFCGTINFVGLVAPHIMRRFIGNDYRFLVPASALAGSVFLLISDMIARFAMAPAVLPISAITSFVGVPTFLYLLLRDTRR